MSDVILKIENLSKQYRLGTVGTGTISHDFNRWWHTIRGKEDPYLKIGESNDRTTKGESEYVWALKDINFEVKRGEVLGVIGKNGAGKSTLLKILSKVTGPTTGSIKSKGRIASLLEVGTGFHPEMTGRENIYLNGAILGMTKKEIASKIDEIIAFSGCERYIDTPVKRYSSGMTVRLAFAVAAHLEPDILIVDEVLAVGDAEFQKKAIGKMQDISSGEGRTVLFVSHDMTAIRNLCPNTILLKNGTIKYKGNTEDIISMYLLDGLKFSKENIVNSIYLNNIQFLDFNNNVIKNNPVKIGQKIIIELELTDTIKENIDYCFIGVENENQRRVFSLSSSFDKDFKSNFTSKNKISCVIDNLNINVGKYVLFVAFGTNTPKQNVEVIRDALIFEVMNDDYFGNGQNILKAQGDIVFNAKWINRG